MDTIQTKVLAQMRRNARKVHISKDFLDLGRSPYAACAEEAPRNSFISRNMRA